MNNLFSTETSSLDKISQVKAILQKDIYFPRKVQKIYSWCMEELKYIHSFDEEKEYLDFLYSIIKENQNHSLKFKPSFFIYSVKAFKKETPNKKVITLLLSELIKIKDISFDEKKVFFLEVLQFDKEMAKNFFPFIVENIEDPSNQKSIKKFFLENIQTLFLFEESRKYITKFIFNSKNITTEIQELEKEKVVECFLKEKACYVSCPILVGIKNIINICPKDLLKEMFVFLKEVLLFYDKEDPKNQFLLFCFIIENILFEKNYKKDFFYEIEKLVSILNQAKLFTSKTTDVRNHFLVFEKLFNFSYVNNKGHRLSELIVFSCNELVEKKMDQIMSLVPFSKNFLFGEILAYFEGTGNISEFLFLFLKYPETKSIFERKKEKNKLKIKYKKAVDFLSMEQKNEHLKTFKKIFSKKYSNELLFLFDLFVKQTNIKAIDVWFILIRKFKKKKIIENLLFKKITERLYSNSDEKEKKRMSKKLPKTKKKKHDWIFFLFALNLKNKSEEINKKLLRQKNKILFLRYIGNFDYLLTTKTSCLIWENIFRLSRTNKIGQILHLFSWEGFFELYEMKKGFCAFFSSETMLKIKNPIVWNIPKQYFKNVVFPQLLFELKEKEVCFIFLKRIISQLSVDFIEKIWNISINELSYRESCCFFKLLKKSNKNSFLIKKEKQAISNKERIFLFSLLVEKKNPSFSLFKKLLFVILKIKCKTKRFFKALCLALCLKKGKKKKLIKKINALIEKEKGKKKEERILTLIDCNAWKKAKFDCISLAKSIIKYEQTQKVEKCFIKLILMSKKEKEIEIILQIIEESPNKNKILERAIDVPKIKETLFKMINKKEIQTVDVAIVLISQKKIDSLTINNLFILLNSNLSIDTFEKTYTFLHIFLTIHCELKVEYLQCCFMILIKWLQLIKEKENILFVEKITFLFELLCKDLFEMGKFIHLPLFFLFKHNIDSLYPKEEKRIFFSLLKMCSENEINILLKTMKKENKVKFLKIIKEYERAFSSFS